jgi:hypothetical protein
VGEGKQRVKGDECGPCTFYVYENRAMKPAENVLRRERRENDGGG